LRMTDNQNMKEKGRRLIVTLSMTFLLLVVAGIGIMAQRSGRIRISAPADFIIAISTIASELPQLEPDMLEESDRRPDLEIFSADPGLRSSPGAGFFAADPLLWVYDRQLIPLDREPGSLQEFASIASNRWQGDGYPILIPGDAPVLLLPILVKIQTDLTGSVNEEALETWNDLIASPATWRESEFFADAFHLLDRWAETGIISPEWQDIDEPAYYDLMEQRRAGAFILPLSWKRAQSRDLSFSWEIIAILPGENLRTYQLTGRVMLMRTAPRRSTAESLAAIEAELGDPEAARLLVGSTGWVPAVSSGPFVNREDRDSRAAVFGADGWVVIP
jgi:hypothetical protein